MAAHSIRVSGYTDDIIIFTIDDRSSPYAECLNIDAHPDSELIRVSGFKSFHRKLCVSFGYDAYKRPYDYFMIKTLPGSFVSKARYDFILYLDSDMLVHAPLDTIFKSKSIVTGYNSRTALKDVKILEKYFSPEERALAQKLNGIGGGVVGVPSHCYSFYEDYRDCYLRFIEEIPHDQPALSFTRVRFAGKYEFETLRRTGYWVHYWGYRKQKMIEDYQAKFA